MEEVRINFFMWYLYLDESGDLGFDFVNKKPSKFFTVTILALSSQDANRKMIKAVKKTLARKLNSKKQKKENCSGAEGGGDNLGSKGIFL